MKEQDKAQYSLENGLLYSEEIILWTKFAVDYLQSPSGTAKKTARKYFENTISNLPYLEQVEVRSLLARQYPSISFRDAVLEGSWNRLITDEKLAIIKDNPQMANEISRKTKPLLQALDNYYKKSGNQNRLKKDQIELTADIYRTLLFQTRVVNMQGNFDNNVLLAEQSVKAAVTGQLKFWKFVCIPELDLIKNLRNFLKWSYQFDTPRYDTLSPSLARDKQIMEEINKLGIKTEFGLLFDDWEAPWLRERERFFSLPNDERQKAISDLKYLREDIFSWAVSKTKKAGVAQPVCYFFSDIVDFYDFVDLIEELKLEGDEKYKGLLNAETEFVSKSSPQLDIPSRIKKAKERIAQYAVEGAIIASSINDLGIYLNSEYPVQQVWKKLTILDAEIPTLFYVTDNEVKNI